MVANDINISSNDYFEISEYEGTLESVLKKENLCQERFDELINLNMLSLPIKKYRDKEGNFFYIAVRDFYLYCKKESSENYFDFCTEKNQYKDIALHANELFLGTFIIKDIVLPFFLNLLSGFISNKLADKDNKITINIIVQNTITNESTKYSFSGTNNDFNEKVIKTLSTYNKNGKINKIEQSGETIDVLY